MLEVTRRLSRSATIALLLSPAGLLLIAVGRLLIISNYNTATATAIVSSGGYIDTVLGTVIPLIPLVLPYVALILLFLNRVILGILCLLATAFVSPMAVTRPGARRLVTDDWQRLVHNVPVDVVMAVVAVPFTVLLVGELFGLGFSVFIKTVATVMSILLIPVVIRLYPFPVSRSYYTELVRQPWLGAQTITLSSGQSFTGYTLSADGNWIVILKDDNRMIYYYRPSDVAALTVCQLGQNTLMQPLITLLPAASTPSHSPVCGASSSSHRSPG